MEEACEDRVDEGAKDNLGTTIMFNNHFETTNSSTLYLVCGSAIQRTSTNLKV